MNKNCEPHVTKSLWEREKCSSPLSKIILKVSYLEYIVLVPGDWNVSLRDAGWEES